MKKSKSRTSVGHSDEEQASQPEKPAIPTITSITIKQKPQPEKDKVFIHEAKPTVH